MTVQSTLRRLSQRGVLIAGKMNPFQIAQIVVGALMGVRRAGLQLLSLYVQAASHVSVRVGCATIMPHLLVVKCSHHQSIGQSLRRC